MMYLCPAAVAGTTHYHSLVELGRKIHSSSSSDSETMQGAEHNYPIHDKEMLAVMRALLCWRAELIGLQQGPFTIFTDHGALKYFSTKRSLSSRQAAWAEILSQYNFHITYRPGKENAAADALSRKAEDLKTQKDKDAQRHMRLFKPLEAPKGGGERCAASRLHTGSGE